MKRVKFRKLKNARDLGGMKTAEGKVLRKGMLIRSGDLSAISSRTANALRAMGVTTVVDLRIENERSAHPDRTIEGSRYLHLPLLCAPAIGITGGYDLFEAGGKESARVKKEGERIKREFGSIDAYMKEVYRSIAFTPPGQEGLKGFFAALRDSEGCVLWHCKSGKDRAGICAMLIEGVLGVDEETILGDYMLSARFLRGQYFINRAALTVVPTSMRLKRILFGLMRTKREYLGSLIDEMKREYGGIVGYCKLCLGMTDADIAFLKNKYLENP